MGTGAVAFFERALEIARGDSFPVVDLEEVCNWMAQRQVERFGNGILQTT